MSARRDLVLWFGAPRRAGMDHDLATRDLRVATVGPGAAPPPWSGHARAAVFSFGTRRDVEVAGPMLRIHAPDLADQGVLVLAAAADDGLMAEVQRSLSDSVALRVASFRTAPDPARIAEDIARHDAGSTARDDLLIGCGDGAPPGLHDERLLRRAFHDCSRIDLVELVGGRSGARVYAVHMTVSGSLAGKRPQPAFAKIGPSGKIQEEYVRYREYAERYVPFGMRPNLKEVIAGCERSLLVGDFIEGSQSLWDLARSGTAGRAINSLLERALAGWRNQAHEEETRIGSVAVAMAEAGSSQARRHHNADYARWAREADDPATVWRRLADLNDQRFRVATVHGDLNGENVRVQDGTAILIDFASVRRPGPSTMDLAHLETWLAFELPRDAEGSGFDDPRWLDEVRRLYSPEALTRPPGPCAAASPLKWIWEAVKPIREAGIASQTDPTEYPTAVAVQLLRRCQWRNGPATDLFRRAQGYRIAADISRHLEGTRTP